MKVETYKARTSIPAHYLYVGGELLMFTGDYARERAAAAAAILASLPGAVKEERHG